MPLRFRMRKKTYIAADPVQFLIGEGFINLFENDLEKIVWVKVRLKVKVLVLACSSSSHFDILLKYVLLSAHPKCSYANGPLSIRIKKHAKEN